MTFTDSQITKLKQLVSEGIQVNSEIEVLKEGLKDTVAAIAEEMDIKPSVLNKVIRVAYKAELDKHRDEFAELETILESIGRG